MSLGVGLWCYVKQCGFGTGKDLRVNLIGCHVVYDYSQIITIYLNSFLYVFTSDITPPSF